MFKIYGGVATCKKESLLFKEKQTMRAMWQFTQGAVSLKSLFSRK